MIQPPSFPAIALFLLMSCVAVHAVDEVRIDLEKRTGIPALERTGQGRVFVAWTTGGMTEPSRVNTCVLCRSDDGGRTFTPAEALALPRSDGSRCYDAALWIDPNGRLWYLFNRGSRDAAIKDVHARLCEAPDAETPVFGPEFRVGFDEATAPYAFRLNKPTVLSSGEWLLPVTYSHTPLHAGWESDKADWGKEPTLQGAAISTDAGKSWQLRGAVSAPPFALEGIITELQDGRLWLLNRSNPVGFLWESFSHDKGQTWSAGRASTIPGPGARFFIRRLSSGHLLLVNHYKFKGRSHLTARLSTDDGRTWNEGLLLDERNGAAYPDGVQDRDGLIWITYDRDRLGAGEILLAKFREEDVAAGKDVSGAVSLRQVINRLEKSPELIAVSAADDSRIAAFKKPTAGRLSDVLSAELRYANANGTVDTRATLIDALISGSTRYRHFEYDSRDFTFPAPGVALMRGRARVHASHGPQRMDNAPMSVLAVWKREGERWRLVAWQECGVGK
jgi:hypothetical protein